MRLLEVSELYNLISRGSENMSSRKESRLLRKEALGSVASGEGFNKVAFDTRRIDQEADYIPRRGLQNYHRSEKFLSDSIAQKIEAFSKLAKMLDQLKLEYGKEPEWQDSYTRVLQAAVNKGLRSEQSDGDFSDCQPSMGSLSYLEELMYVRYRLTANDIMGMTDENLRKAILHKDELLVRQGISNIRVPELVSEITPSDVSKYSYDSMMEKMLSTMAQVMSSYKPPTPEDTLTSKLFDVQATSNAPEVERTVTITIKDKIVDKVEQFEKKSQESLKEQEKLKSEGLEEDADTILANQ